MYYFSVRLNANIEEHAIPVLPTLIAIFAGALVATNPAAGADVKFPNLVRIIVPFGPGGSNDVIARAIAGPLAKRLETSVIVDNKEIGRAHV